jgi:hypothetical protein
MTRNRIRLALLLLAAAALLVWAPPILAATCSWQKTPAPRIHGSLHAVSARTASDTWAVGVSVHQTLAEHWNGTSWRRVPTPNPGGRADWLRAVVDITRTDAWAVGGFGPGPTLESTGPLLLHWNGVVWKRRRLPRSVHRASLAAITATSPHDVWIVGSSHTGLSRVLHYDGSGWTLVPIPDAIGSNLSAAASSSASDVWALGTTTGFTSLFEHWDGHAWRALVPNLPVIFAQSIADTSPTDAWASGEQGVDHWDGSAWTAITSPPNRYLIEFVAASGPTDVWVSAFDESVVPTELAAGHWNGAHWTFTDIPSRDPAAIEAITNVPTTQTFWQAGFTRHFAGGTIYETPRNEFCS